MKWVAFSGTHYKTVLFSRNLDLCQKKSYLMKVEQDPWDIGDEENDDDSK